jgi:ribosomal protein S18 acetylase RimI-like enzyme
MLWYVDNEHQGKGLGRELLDTMCNELTQRQFKSVVVDVRKTSSNAINSYLKNDFKLQSSTFLSQVLIKELDCTR